MFSFLRKFHTVFPSGSTSLHSHQQCTRVPFSPQPLHTCCLLISLMAILTGVKLYLIVVLICISLRASDAEQPFIRLWAPCMSSEEKCLFKSFAHFLIGLFVFLEWSCVSSYIFWRSGPCLRCHLKYVYPYSWFSFHFNAIFLSHAHAFLFWWGPICLFFPLCPLL